MERDLYRDFEIFPTDPRPPIPTWRQFAWTWVHKDYDGEGDHRLGHEASESDCRAMVDEWHVDHLVDTTRVNLFDAVHASKAGAL